MQKTGRKRKSTLGTQINKIPARKDGGKQPLKIKPDFTEDSGRVLRVETEVIEEES